MYGVLSRSLFDYLFFFWGQVVGVEYLVGSWWGGVDIYGGLQVFYGFGEFVYVNVVEVVFFYCWGGDGVVDGYGQVVYFYCFVEDFVVFYDIGNGCCWIGDGIQVVFCQGFDEVFYGVWVFSGKIGVGDYYVVIKIKVVFVYQDQ